MPTLAPSWASSVSLSCRCSGRSSAVCSFSAKATARRPARAALQRRQSLHQREAVGQAGEAVEMRQAMNFLRCALALGDVLLELYIVADVAVGLADGGHHHGLGNLGAVLAAVDLLARPALAAGQGGAQAVP